jgi:hypothetical protein
LNNHYSFTRVHAESESDMGSPQEYIYGNDQRKQCNLDLQPYSDHRSLMKDRQRPELLQGGIDHRLQGSHPPNVRTRTDEYEYAGQQSLKTTEIRHSPLALLLVIISHFPFFPFNFLSPIFRFQETFPSPLSCMQHVTSYCTLTFSFLLKVREDFAGLRAAPERLKDCCQVGDETKAEIGGNIYCISIHIWLLPLLFCCLCRVLVRYDRSSINILKKNGC